MSPGHEAVGDLAPLGVELDRRDGEHEQAEAHIAEDPLYPPEGQHPGADGQTQDRHRDQEAIGKA